MTIQINGTSGISGVDGSAATPALQGSDTNTGISFGADTVNVNTGGSTRATVDSSGRVGIGTASPGRSLEIGTSQPAIKFNNGTDAWTIGTGAFIDGSDSLCFFEEGVGERMRITQGGNVFINSTSNPAVGTEMFGVAAQSSGQTIAAGFANSVNTAPTVFVANGSNTTNTYLMRFASGSGGTTRGEIYYNGSQLVYATSSDYRLKENVIDFDGGVEIVKQLRPVRYNWIENGNQDIGFIAHEVQAVFPNAVGGEKDAVDEDGKILPQTYDPSKLVPLLTAALQEAIAKIETLETRLTALEGGAAQ